MFSSHLFWPCTWDFIHSCATEAPLTSLRSAGSLQQRQTCVFHCSMEGGVGAVPLGGTARGNQGGKLAVCSASGRKQTIYSSLFALITSSRSHRYLLPCFPASLYCVDVTVVNVSFTDWVKAHPDPPRERHHGESTCRHFGFDHHCGQPPRFESKYHPR